MDRRNQAHILVMPCMVQSHIIPHLEFSKLLASKNQIVTLICTSSSTNPRFAIDNPEGSSSTNFRVEHLIISDHNPEECLRPANAKNQLSQLIKKLVQSDFPPKALVYDVGMPWALDVALAHGLHGAVFFTTCCAVNAVHCLVKQSGREIPVTGRIESYIPSFPVLEQADLQSLLTRDCNLYPKLMKLVLDHFLSVQKVKCHLVNSFMELEEEAVKWMRSQISCPILTVGPTALPMYLDKTIIKGKHNHVLSHLNPNTEPCTKWLDSKESGSVIYVSFGSLASLGKEQMEEVAWGLKNTNKHFIWVMRDSDKTKLPVGFLDAEKGLVVNWCSQLQVLEHVAIGCFMSHCGWNSTLEALSLGVPMVAMPQWVDQLTTAKFVTDVWKVGVRVRVDENGVGRREEIEVCVKEVMDGDKGKEMKSVALRWRELAHKAVRKGGSSYDNIDKFIASIIS